MVSWVTATLIAAGCGVIGWIIGRFVVPMVEDRKAKRVRRDAIRFLASAREAMQGDLPAARRELEAVLESSTSDPEPYFVLADGHRADGNYERSARIHQSLAVRPALSTRQRYRARAELARDYLRLGQVAGAEQEVEWVLGQDKNDPVALDVAAELFEETGAWDRASAVLARAARKGGPEATDRLAHVHAEAAVGLAREGEVRAGRRVLRSAPDEPGTRGRAHLAFARASLLAADGKPRHATTAFVEAIRLAPDLVDIIYPGLVEQLGALGTVAEAEKILRELAAEAPDDVPVRLALARFLRGRDPADARRELGEILARQPEHLAARCLLAEILLSTEGSAGDETLRREYAGLVAAAQRLRQSWRCVRCGAGHPGPAWRCSACGRWDGVSYSLVAAPERAS